jgi:hypothetical protein
MPGYKALERTFANIARTSFIRRVAPLRVSRPCRETSASSLNRDARLSESDGAWQSRGRAEGCGLRVYLTALTRRTLSSAGGALPGRP